jgi:hypothetical protein
MLKRIAIFIATFLLIVPTSYTYLEENNSNENHELKDEHRFNNYVTLFHERLGTKYEKPEFEVFHKAITGFFTLKSKQKIENNLLTIIDFTLSSNVERLWIVDINKMEIIHKSLVSHGRNSGELYAEQFSNIVSSYQSSLGFFITGDIYYGKHGMSLYLDGIESGINDKARERAIVMHSADYVSSEFIKIHGRLGRSHGCPAIPMENHKQIITSLSGGSCLFIYHNDRDYLESSTLLAQNKAMDGMVRFFLEAQEEMVYNPALPLLISSSF